MKRIVPLGCLLLLTAATCHNQPPQNQTNMAWDAGPKVYSTGSTGIPLSGFGINSMVDVLPAGPLPLTVAITKILRNTGTVAIPAGYTVTDTVQAMKFTAVVGSGAAFTPVSGPPLAALSAPGPALAPGDSATISFSFAVPGCGMYREILNADVAGTVTESNKADNRVEHFFAVPGSMTLQITAVHNGNTNLWHTAVVPPPNPSWTRLLPGLPFNAVTYTITPGAGTTFWYNYYQGIIRGAHGAVARITGPAPVQPPAAPVAGAVTGINLQLQTVNTHDVGFVDILLDVGREQLSGKVTAITGDGCFARQRQESFFVMHPGSSP